MCHPGTPQQTGHWGVWCDCVPHGGQWGLGCSVTVSPSGTPTVDSGVGSVVWSCPTLGHPWWHWGCGVTMCNLWPPQWTMVSGGQSDCFPLSGTPMVGSGVGGAVSPCSSSPGPPRGRDVTLSPFWGPHVTGNNRGRASAAARRGSCMTGTVTGTAAGLGTGPPAGTAVPFGHCSPLNLLGVTSSRTKSQPPSTAQGHR